MLYEVITFRPRSAWTAIICSPSKIWKMAATANRLTASAETPASALSSAPRNRPTISSGTLHTISYNFV